MDKSSIKKLLQFLFFTGLGVFILALVYNSQNKAFLEQCRLDGTPMDQCNLIDKLLADFSTVSPIWMFMVVLAFTLSNLFRARRWQMLLEPMGYKISLGNSLLTILLGYFANLGLPRMGEVVRAGSLARYEKIPLEKVMGTLVVDRLMDFLCLGLVVGLTFIFEGGTIIEFINSNRGEAGGQSLFQNPWVQAILLAGVLGLAVLFLFRKRLMQLGFVKKIMGLVEGFMEGLRSVLRLKQAGLFIALSLGIWLMFYLQCWFNLEAFPPTADLGMSAALMILSWEPWAL
ncbi:MAG: lysylphosphatidylglycerol synthase transmembrane domain-containing protein [Saprospiraceae bacterium]